MKDFLLLMHKDAARGGGDWGAYFAKLRASGGFDGGSGIGDGTCFRKEGEAAPPSAHLAGYIRIRAESLDAARALLAGNPVYENGGTVEIRELPRE